MTDDSNSFYGHADDASQLEELKAAQQEALSKVNATGVNAEINIAAQKLVAQDLDGAIEEYEGIKVRHPDVAAICEHQIGVAWFFKGDYKAAIQHYEFAKALGAEGMDEEIEEAAEMLAKG